MFWNKNEEMPLKDRVEPTFGPAESLTDKRISELEQSLSFYRRRCEELQRVQSNMRDPERKAVCDILANGKTYVYDGLGDNDE